MNFFILRFVSAPKNIAIIYYSYLLKYYTHPALIMVHLEVVWVIDFNWMSVFHLNVIIHKFIEYRTVQFQGKRKLGIKKEGGDDQ